MGILLEKLVSLESFGRAPKKWCSMLVDGSDSECLMLVVVFDAASEH